MDLPPAMSVTVGAVHAGDVAALERLLDAEPRLLTDRIREPDCYRDSGRDQYFLDPKLFWFVANNPTPNDDNPENVPLEPTPSLTITTRPGLVEYPFPLREGVFAYLRLPVDLSAADVKRLTADLAALVIDADAS